MWAKNRGFLTPKVKFAEAGYPDRLFVSPSGHTVWIEFKKPGEQPDPLQVYRLRELATRKQISIWCDNYDDAVSILKECLDPASVSNSGDQTPLIAVSVRPVPRPGTGEDKHGLSSPKDPKGEGPNYESADRSPAAPYAEGVAGRNTEVGRLPGPIVGDTAREEQVSKLEIARIYPYRKPGGH